MESDESGPQHFLNSMEPHLGIGGCIKSVDEVEAVVQAMKNARLMVNKCLLLNIIKATKTGSTLESLMGLGGWTILNIWLSDSKKTQNVALLIQLMQVLMQLPVTLECLKQGNMGKLVKQLTKQENQEVKTLASELLTKWMAIFKQSKSKKDDEQGDRASKRPRDLPTSAATSSFHVPPDKKAKNSPTKLKTGSSAAGAAGMTESTGFMNAISSQVAAVAKLKKPKRPPLKHSSSQSTTTVPSSSQNATGRTGSSSSSTVTDTAVDGMESTGATSKDTDNPQSSGIEKSKAKKRVSFASDDALAEIFYFEMDESERSAMRSRNFLDAAQAEKMREREAMENVKLLYHDNMIEMTPWVRPSMIDGVVPLVNMGCMSEQKRVQMEREQRVLAELFLDKKSLPFSPAEPDPETTKDETEPKQIPLWEPGMEPQELTMLPPGAPLPGADMNAPYNQQHLQQGGIPLSPGIDAPLMPQPQLPDQHYFHGPDGQDWRPHPQGGFPQHRGPPLPSPGSHNWGGPRGPSERGGRGSRQVCKHFASHGCRLGAACRFLHPPEYNRNIRTNT